MTEQHPCRYCAHYRREYQMKCGRMEGTHPAYCEKGRQEMYDNRRCEQFEELEAA